MNIDDHDKMLHHIRGLLDRDVDRLDSVTTQRLETIRNQALQRERVREPLNDSEENLLEAVRVALDDSVTNLDPALCRRLKQSRSAALEQHGEVESRNLLTNMVRGWNLLLARFATSLPGRTLATACILVAAITLFYRTPEQPGNSSPDGDVLLFASSDEIELYDNLEFYLWLADSGLPN
ncbi:MAG: DUF3619 family protein [Gammaproteobacteria bacterium]|nr:DUF3619 family protein [Pseudomonadales bacterium]MCP5345687.1 DUF3619 family protein [Pseudomonadales bacterium]